MELQSLCRRIGALFAFMACASLAQAASFDCARAHAPMERAVCADPQVSAADTLLAQRYGAAMAQLSEAGKHIVQDGQRQWLRYVRALCVEHGRAEEASECLRQAYDARLEDLTLAAVRVGPYLFSRMDFYEAANPDDRGVLSRGQIAAPRIDAPLTPVAVEWNQEMTRLYAAREHHAGCDGPSGDYAVNYKIVGATPAAISIVMHDSMYCHGTAHGYGGAKSLTYVTAPRLHLLSAPDLFRPDADWTAFLVQRCTARLQADYGGHAPDRKALAEAVRRPESWAVGKQGLVITLDALEVGAGPGQEEIAVSWVELGPFLTVAASKMF